MAFPADPRDLKLWLAFGHSAAEDPTGVTFVQVAPSPEDDTDPGPTLGVVTITRGRVGGAPTTNATTIETSLRDTDGEFSPRNVTGDHYGELLLDTPVQVTVDTGFGDTPLATAYQPDWNPQWDGPDINDRAPINAVGMLAIVGRDQSVKSALHRAILARADTQAYWHMEDAGGDFASGIADQPPLTVSGVVDFAAVSELDGTGPLPNFTTSTTVAGTVDGAFTDRWYVSWLTRFESTPSARTTLMDIFVSGGTADRWRIEADSTTLYMTGFLGGATVYSDTGSANNLLIGDDGWIAVVALVVDGSGFGFNIYDLQTSSFVGCQGSSVGIVAGSVIGISVPASAQLDGIPVGHIAAFSASLPDDLYIPSGPFPVDGYDGEEARDRIQRLCDEEGITAQLFGADSAAMGPQLPGTTLALLRECEAADHGVLVEGRDGRLQYYPVDTRYNASVSMTLEYGTEAEPGEVSWLRQFDDRRDVFNRVTVTRASGSSATAQKADGPLGTVAIGVKRLPVTLNLSTDTQLAHHAGYLLYAGTIDKPRYVVVLDLFGNPDLAVFPGWVFSAPLGARITISGAPTKHVGPDDLDLIVEGEVIELGPDRWLVTMWCEPYEPWRAQQLTETPPDDDLVDGWLIPDSLELDTGVDGDDTSWSVAIDPLMSTSADDLPARAVIGGEEILVTAVSGASSPQTWTVTRSVNDVVKSHSAGDAIELLDPIVASL